MKDATSKKRTLLKWLLSCMLLLIILGAPVIYKFHSHFETRLSHPGIRLRHLETRLKAMLGGAQTHARRPTKVGFQRLGSANGQGTILNSMVGPGVSASKQLYYLNYSYYYGTMDFVAVDPNTGQFHAYPSPVASEQGAWGLTAGPDQNMYIGTLPDAHVLQFNTSVQHLTDLGPVPPDPAKSTPQQYIWQMTLSPYNHTIYGCTYPSADLFSYNPLAASPQIINLGSLDTTGQEQYARTCVADPNPNSPYIYVGLGAVSTQIVAYNISTRVITPLLASSSASFGWVEQRADGNVYGYIRSCSSCQYYMLQNGSSSQVSSNGDRAPTNILNSGGTITVGTNTITILGPRQLITTYPYTYSEPLSIFHIALGPDGNVYGSTVLPDNFFSFNPAHPTAGVEMKGVLGDGETYTLLSYNKLLYLVGYSLKPIEVYDPSKAFSDNTNPLANQAGNLPNDLRAEAIIAAPNDKLYIGSSGSYGKLSGPLIVWSTLNDSDVQEFFPMQNQGVSSLTTTSGTCQDDNASYCIIGGTTIFGGEGTTPATTTAQLFSWDPNTNTVIHQYTIPNIDTPSKITDLITNPANGYVYGIATNSNNAFIFVFNPATGQFINAGTPLPFYYTMYNSIAIYNGYLWGLTYDSIFKINVNNVTQATVIPTGVPVTAGFAMSDNTLYFASNNNLWAYTTP